MLCLSVCASTCVVKNSRGNLAMTSEDSLTLLHNRQYDFMKLVTNKLTVDAVHSMH